MHALAPLVRMLATMAIDNAAVVACCPPAHHVIPLPVYSLYTCSYLHRQKLSIVIFLYYFITHRLSSAVLEYEYRVECSI